MHARSIAAAAIDTWTGELFRRRLVASNEVVSDWLRGLPQPVAVTYEAGADRVWTGADAAGVGDQV